MATILEEIVEQTAIDLKKRKGEVTYRELESMELYEQPARDFKEALQTGEGVAIIAEIKKASPSKGLIRHDFNPRQLALQYQQGGASAISVLTDRPAFQGDLKYLADASMEVSIPLMRKDFIVDPYQIKEARAYGADAALLIATITEGHQLEELLHACREFGIQALVECYSQKDLELVNFEYVDILGVNNRDLHSFTVDLHRGIDLLQQASPETVLVSESGISSAEDLYLLYREKIHAALIGEHFMRQAEPGAAVKNIKQQLQVLIDDDHHE